MLSKEKTKHGLRLAIDGSEQEPFALEAAPDSGCLE